MARITKLEQQKKNPQRFNIYLDGQFGFGADEDLVVDQRLVVGREINAQDLEKILFKAAVGKLMEKMYRWFGIRMRSEKEVRDYFRIKNQELRINGKEEVSGLLVDMVVDNLKHKGMVNDEKFARAWVDSRRRSKKKGDRVLKMELFQKGIDREIVKRALEESGDGETQEALAKEALEKKAKVWKKLDRLKLRKKATEFLLRRGFEYSIVKEVIDNYLKKDYNSF